MSGTRPTISILGSTGGTGLALLLPCLAASYNVTVLVRNSQKLLDLLSISESSPNLHIVTGSVTSPDAVKQALYTKDGKLVDILVSCVGILPKFDRIGSLFDPFTGCEDPHFCENATKMILSCIEDLSVGGAGKRPLLVQLSTTGVTTTTRDLPIAMIPFYHWFGRVPHADKKRVENLLNSSAVPDSQPWILVRPSLLTGDGKAGPSANKIRVGTEKAGVVENLEIGYTISREDVGAWMFREIIEAGGERRQWVGKAVTLTY